MTATWKPMLFEGCGFCGEPCEIHTYSPNDAYYDGDAVRCTVCGATGVWCVDDDDEPATAFVSWAEEVSNG